MANASIPIKMKAVAKIQKYPEWATTEDIEKGLVEPIEVVESVDHFEMAEDEVDDLFKK